MDYTEQFIRLNCSLMSDYKMMKLNADMKCMGLELYLETILCTLQIYTPHFYVI